MNQPAKPSAVSSKWINDTIQNFLATAAENTLKNKENDKAFEQALVGFVAGNDPLYEAFKEHVGPFHLTPLELFAITFRDFKVKPENLTVISWILPHTKMTKAANRKEKFYPAERWARARIFGEAANAKLREHVVASLTKAGVRAVSPGLTPQFSMRLSPKYGLASTWSERHSAYAAGLGTFGLCDGLITPVGKAMRVGSVIAEIDIPASIRPYNDHQAYCLFYSHGTCGKCIPKCPVGAITEKGKNKQICRAHLFPVTSDYVKKTYGFDGYGCGHCQTGVPCESKIPLPKDG
jgi:epoxyqueuosine reductase